jgi:arylsulfatase A-like enzyme
MLDSSFLTRKAVTWLGQYRDPRFILARKDGLTVNSEFLEWLDGAQGRPFFAFLNYMDAHDPYEPPPKFAGLFGTSARPVSTVNDKTRKTWDMEKLDPDNYDCGLAALDAYVGQLLDELERRGVLGNTLVVIVGDHGEHFGEHGYFVHGDTLYMPVLHVPLVVMFPGQVPAGVRVRGPASLRDLAATTVDVLGLTDGSPFPGTSLRSRWDERRAPARPAFSYLDLWYNVVINGSMDTLPVRLRSVVDEDYQYIEGVGESFRALFDLKRDPNGENDLSTAKGKEAVVNRYHELVQRGPS